jgi:hypothetical protein
MERDYSKSKIYKLYVPGEEQCYVGSTTWELNKRLQQHKYSYIYDNQKKSHSCVLFTLGEVHIELLEEYPCNSIQELRQKEAEWIQNTPTAVNKNVPGRTMKQERTENWQKYAEKCKEWRKKNKEHVEAYDKAYKEANKQKIAESKKKYRQANAEAVKAYKQEVITCEVCGEQTTRGNKWRHMKKHT